jgi:5-methylcytosine-specific restriction enzyme A
MARNPAWTYDELILALDVYLNHSNARSSKNDPALIHTSNILRSLPIHEERGNPDTFREINSVYLKLQNFKSVDPSYAGVGMPAGAGPRERLVWSRFAHDPVALHDLAMMIAREARTVTAEDVSAAAADEPDDTPVVEGRILLAKHRRRESKGAAKKKRHVLKATGRLVCEACGFDFESTYGELGRGFAECHHLRPLADGVRETRLRDLAIVCSNCHRMIHRRLSLLSIEELRAAITLSGTSATVA